MFSLDIFAGALVAFAALPKLLKRFRDQRSSTNGVIDYGDLQRDGLIILGNLLWVVFGLQHQIYGLVIFGAINVFFTGLLVLQSIMRATPKPM